MMLIYVSPHDTATAWVALRPYIRMASGQVESMTALRRRVACGELLLAAVMIDGEVCGAMLFEQCLNNLHVISLAGVGFPKDWPVYLLPECKRLAGMLGRDGITFNGRKGQARKLSRLGFVPVGDLMRCAL